MRRRETAGPAAPERLCRFVVGEWPGATREDAFRAWGAARLEFVARYPNTSLGDALDVLAGHVELQRRWASGQAD